MTSRRHPQAVTSPPRLVGAAPEGGPRPVLRGNPVYMSMGCLSPENNICSQHRTLGAAYKAAIKCEKDYGGKHYFWEVMRVWK